MVRIDTVDIHYALSVAHVKRHSIMRLSVEVNSVMKKALSQFNTYYAKRLLEVRKELIAEYDDAIKAMKLSPSTLSKPISPTVDVIKSTIITTGHYEEMFNRLINLETISSLIDTYDQALKERSMAIMSIAKRMGADSHGH